MVISAIFPARLYSLVDDGLWGMLTSTPWPESGMHSFPRGILGRDKLASVQQGIEGWWSRRRTQPTCCSLLRGGGHGVGGEPKALWVCVSGNPSLRSWVHRGCWEQPALGIFWLWDWGPWWHWRKWTQAWLLMPGARVPPRELLIRQHGLLCAKWGL